MIFARTKLATLIAAAAFGSLAGCAVHATTEVAAPAPAPPPPPAEQAAPPPPAPVVEAAPPPPPTPTPPLSPLAQAHPSYLHALSDLRNARWNLERKGGDPVMKWDEHHSIEAIDRAINDIKKAAIDDGKNLQDRPPVDASEPRAGRLHKALAALQAARNDVSQEEDNAFAKGLRVRGIKNIDEAIRLTEQGIAEADRTPAPPPAPMVAVQVSPVAQAHPSYLHALSDLRNARWNLERKGGDPAMKWDERHGVESIDRAINDIKKAAIDDGKNLQDRPLVDATEPRSGRLHKALAALQAARSDVSQEEDNAFASGLRARGIKNIDDAIRVTEQGIAEADRAPAPVAAASPAPAPAAAMPPAQAHPSYLHALSDLRNARWNLERKGGDPVMKWDEHHSIDSIDHAINDIKKAAIDDGKNLQDHPSVDATEPRSGRLHKALAALQAARNDVSQEEDNAFADGLRARGIKNIDDAIRFTEQGIAEADRAPPPVAAAPPAAVVPPAQAHPSYLHALSDLRNARWNLERKGGDPVMKWDEHHSIDSIDHAINDIKKAAIDDGKNLQDHPSVDATEPRSGRLHKALAALQAARNDVTQEEDNAFADGLRARGIKNIDDAIRFTEQGIAEADRPAPAPVAAAAPAPAPAAAPPPAKVHPAYLHALSDLRNARSNLERRGGDRTMKWDEHRALDAIDHAMAEIKRAAIDDGKSLDDHPPIDAREPRPGRLHRALSALQAARRDVSEEEDNGFANGLKARGLHDIDDAIRFAEEGISEAESKI
jgi:D-alanyl-D-alanine carboxypeptidase